MCFLETREAYKLALYFKSSQSLNVVQTAFEKNKDVELGHFVTVSSVCEHGQVQLHKGIQLMSPQPFPVRCEACAMQIQ